MDASRDMVMMKGGRMITMMNGEMLVMDKDLVTTDGTQIRTDGVIITPDGMICTLVENESMIVDLALTRRIEMEKPFSSGFGR